MHVDPDVLGLLALGEQAGTESEREHLAGCAECSGELSDLHRLVAQARSAGPEPMSVPAPDVWARIRSELHLTPTLEASATTSAPVLSVVRDSPDDETAHTTAHARAHTTRDEAGEADEAGESGEATGRHETSRAHRSLRDFLRNAIPGRHHLEETAAQARLSPVEEFWSKASGTAELSTDHQGRRVLQLALHADLPESGLRQAWLVHRDDPSRRQTLGILDGLHGLWTVDHSIDLESYAILEVSQQRSGESDYSGDPIVRGELIIS